MSKDYFNASDKLNTRLFWNKVNKAGPDDCWLWQGYTDEDGYGHHKASGKTYRAHRVAYYVVYNTFPEVVMHECDNPACNNPNHLKGGTHAENIRDRDRKGRTARGSRHGRAKLDEQDVREIRRKRREKGVTQQELAEEYGVSPSNIGRIEREETWPNVGRSSSKNLVARS